MRSGQIVCRLVRDRVQVLLIVARRMNQRASSCSSSVEGRGTEREGSKVFAAAGEEADEHHDDDDDDVGGSAIVSATEHPLWLAGWVVD